MREGAAREWRGSRAAVPMAPRIRSKVTEGRLENGDGGGDGNSLRFYVAITLPQMPLSEIDGVVNLFSAWREKETHLIFGTCWWDYSTRCEIKFLGGQTAPSAQ